MNVIDSKSYKKMPFELIGIMSITIKNVTLIHFGGVGLCYDHNWSKHDEFEICYFDFRDVWKQIRTIIE